MKGNKIVGFLIIFFLITSNRIFSQNEITGTYSYKFTKGTYSYFETISLYPDGHFSYKMKGIMGLQIDVFGNWQKRNSCLILDSYPQRDKIIVNERFEKKVKGMIFNVTDKGGMNISYRLSAILQSGDTLMLWGQLGKVAIQERVKSFWIEDTKGLKSPQRIILSNVANVINVIFETQRVFENEDWTIIDEKKLNPRGLQGEFQNYYLNKKE